MSTKRKREPRKNGKPWPNNIGAWIASMSAEQRTQLVQRAARAQWGPEKVAPKKADDGPWIWPIDLDRYDRASALTAVEHDMLMRYEEAYRFYRYGRHMDFGPKLDRLVRPLNDALDYTGIPTSQRRYTLQFLLREMAERRRSFWGWTSDEWIESIHRRKLERQHLLGIAYLLCGFSDLHRIENDGIIYLCLARKVFGRAHVDTIVERMRVLLAEWGYAGDTHKRVLRTVCEVLLYLRDPHLEKLSLEHLHAVVARHPPRTGSYCIVAFSRVLAGMGIIPEALKVEHPVPDKKLSPGLTIGVPAEWGRFCRLWYDRAICSARNKHKSYYFLLNIGRWLSQAHPDITSPAEWTRELAAEAVSVVCQWRGTQHYAKIAPLKIAKSYADAGYFARNLRAIEVLVDQDVVRSGRAATEPWKFYDLGHGYCTYDFFDQCQHRMACAKCDFYMPKESTAALLLAG